MVRGHPQAGRAGLRLQISPAVSVASAPSVATSASVRLTSDWVADQKAFERCFRDGVDVVLDYLWGPSAEHLLIAAKAGGDEAPLRFVHIGAVSGPEISLPGAVLRSSAVQLMGSGFGSVPMERILASIRELLAATVPASLRIGTQTLALADVQQGWADAAGAQRTVFRTG